MVYKSREDLIADEYFKHLNGTLAFIILGIYFSIIESENFQSYAIVASIVVVMYITFNFPEYTSISKNYTKRYKGISKVLSILRIGIFSICCGLLWSAALGYKLLKNLI